MASALVPDHVVLVVEENHDYSDIIGNPEAPYFNQLAREGVLFTSYHGVARPSQPNYLALFSGSTQGVDDNSDHFFSAPTLAGQLVAAGYSFAGFAEADSPRKHNPWESFEDSAGRGRDFSTFPSDFSALPTVSFVSPSQAHDMHDGSVAEGDRWLQDHLGAYATWAQTHNSLLVVTFDEDGGGEGQHIATVVTGAGLGPLQSAQALDHYGLLHTIESFYGLPALGLAAEAPVMDLASAQVPPAGRLGNDLVRGGSEADSLVGGPGRDTLYGGAGNDTLYGRSGNDRLYGQADDDWLYASSGNDLVSGGEGQDRIFGGAGRDSLYGQGGQDAFVFTGRASATNLDRVRDYNVRDDSVWLENKVFKALGKAGSLADPAQLKAQFFWKGEAAHDADDHVIYNQKTGALYYDADGTGAAQQVQIAQLSKHLKMTFKDFFVV